MSAILSVSRLNNPSWIISKDVFEFAKNTLISSNNLFLPISEDFRNKISDILKISDIFWIDIKNISYEWFVLALKKFNVWVIGSCDISIYNEMKVLRDIVGMLKTYHLSYINELDKWKRRIAFEKDHNSCDFANYLKQKEWLIKNKFLLSILNLINELHLKFHEEAKNHKDISSILYLNDLLNILDILLKHEETLYFDEKTELPNLEKLKKDIEDDNFNIIHLIKLNWISNVNLLYSFEIWDKILLKVVDFLRNFFSSNWLVFYRTWWLEFWILWWSEDFFKEFYEKYNIINIELNELWLVVPIKFSIWWANSCENLYDKALQALHESRGNWGYVTYSKSLEVSIRNRVDNNLKWIMEVNNAINLWNLVTYFQWIRDNNKWKITREEALVRIEKDWKVYSPWLFLEQAKEWWLLWKITMLVLRDTITRIKKSNNSCSLNVPEQVLADNDMINNFTELVLNSWINPKMLTVEVLESITNNNIFIENIKKLRELWIKIAIDDFWTWYSNFARIIELKPDYLKIDWSLIKWLSGDKDKQNIVRSIVNLAHLCWSEVIAEFVDNNEDQRTLEILWIEYSQWYLFSKPEKWD